MDYITLNVDRLGDEALVEINGKEYIDLEKCKIARIGFQNTWELVFATKLRTDKTRTGKLKVSVFIPKGDKDDKSPIEYIGNGVQIFKEKNDSWSKQYDKPFDSSLR